MGAGVSYLSFRKHFELGRHFGHCWGLLAQETSGDFERFEPRRHFALLSDGCLPWTVDCASLAVHRARSLC